MKDEVPQSDQRRSSPGRPSNQPLQTDESEVEPVAIFAASSGLRPEGDWCRLAPIAVLSATTFSADSPLSGHPLCGIGRAVIELLNPIILFALVFFGLAVRGLLEARLERIHADVLKDLGGGPILVPPAAPSGRREWAWAKFMAWKHFGVRDPVLSIFCLLGSTTHLLIILMMVGLVEFP